jgi:hypothetical protein
MFFIWLYTLACTIPPLFNWGQVRPAGLKNLTLEHEVFLEDEYDGRNARGNAQIFQHLPLHS